MPRILLFTLCLALLSVACRPDRGAGVTLSSESTLTEEEKGRVLARIEDPRDPEATEVITLERFEARLGQQSPFVRAQYSSLARKREFLQGLVEFELLLQEARAAGLAEDEEVKRAHRQATVRRLLEVESAARISAASVSAEEIAAHYEAHRDDFRRPTQVRASHAVFETREDARFVGELLGMAWALVPSFELEIFDDLAEGYGGGDLGFFAVEGDEAMGIERVVAEAAFALELGGLSAPVEGSTGWHLIQKRGQRPPKQRPLSEVKAQIHNTLFRARKRAALTRFVEGLCEGAEVWIDEGALASGPNPKEAK